MTENIVTLDQIISLSVSIALLFLSIGVIRHVPAMRGFGIAILMIACASVAFYLVAILTTVNESDRVLFSVISGIRSIFTYTVLCGVCVMWLKLYAGFWHE